MRTTITTLDLKLSSSSNKTPASGIRRPLQKALYLLTMVAFLLAVVLPAAAEEGPPRPPSSTVSRAELTGYEIRFRGNRDMSPKQLRETADYELERFKKKGYRPADADDAAYQMELAYKDKGYAFATVDYQYEIVGKKAVVTFEINEGPRVRIDHITITGNRAFSADELRAFFQQGGKGPLYYVRTRVEAAVSDISNLYYEQGFMEARIEGPEIKFSSNREEAEISVVINEGARYRISEIKFAGDLPPEVRRKLAALNKKMVGEPYNRRQNLELSSRIGGIYANAGYPDVKADIQVGQREKPSQVLLTAEIHSGPRVRISAIEIIGAHQTKKSFIESRLALHPGDFYSAKAQRRSFRTLYQTGLFSRVDFSLAKGPDPQHRVLKVEVKEAPTRDLSVEAGWGSYELLRLRLGFQKKNLFGTGRSIRTELGGSTKSANLTATLIDPWFLRTDITANIPVYYNYRIEPSYTSREIGSSVLFSKKLGKRLSATWGYNYKNTSLTNVDVTAEVDSLNNYNLGSFKSGLTYDSRNDLLFPTRGMKSHVTAEIADTLLGSQIDFIRFTAGASRYYSLRKGKSTVLALRYNTGFMVPRRGQNTIPLNERFFNGGENTVRSFRQDQLGPKDANGNPIGGDAYNVFNIELRHQLRGPLIGTLFFDYGNVSPNKVMAFGTSESELISATFSQYFRDMRPGVGAGLQYLLPVGPARLDAAFNPVAREGETNYVILFSVGPAF
jgi:outer membrane protein insertion porin family